MRSVLGVFSALCGVLGWGAGCASGPADGVLEGEPGRGGVEAVGANTEHRAPSGMCGTGAADAAGVCQDAAVGPGGSASAAGEPGGSASAAGEPGGSASAAGEPGGDGRYELACRRRPFSRQFAGAGATLRGFTLDKTGRALLAGSFEGEMTFGGTRLMSVGASDAFVAKLDACGDPLWIKRFGDAAAQGAIDVAAGTGGNTLVLGDFSGTLDLGARQLSAASPWGADLFLAKLGPEGATRWAAQITPEEDAILSGTALAADDRDGGALVLGRLEGAATVAGVRIERRSIGAFVVRLDASGRFAWVSYPPSGADSEEIGIEVDEDGDAILASQDARGTATSVTKLDEDGAVEWHQRFRGSSDQLEMAFDIAVDPDGAALLSGSGVFGDPALPGGPRPFVAKLDDGGDVVWVKRFDAQNPRRVAASEDTVVLAGDALCEADDPASCSAWAAGLTEDGEARWTQRIGADVQVAGLEVGPMAQPVLAGSFRGTITLGSGNFSSEQGALFVTRLAESD
ncbi:hypothetical protein [Sorangium sp. So ce1182]|uniref:hypothetical protein n=1 Tax=Sorangium sp. So ce1182 TaxID=3133334 RepID=UPI003F62FEA8